MTRCRENGNDRRRDANRTISAIKRSSQHVRGVCHDQECHENVNDRRRDANRTVSADKRSSRHVRRGRAMTRSFVRMVMTGGRMPTEPYQLIKDYLIK